MDQRQTEYLEYMKTLDDKSILELTQYTEDLAAFHRSKGEDWICSNHRLELYLCKYWGEKKNLQQTDYALHVLFRTIAQKSEACEEMEAAEKAYQESMKWNPADLDTQFALARFYSKQGDWYAMKETTEKVYLYLFTSIDLARYYRFLGKFYLETYEPKVAYALYQYSKLWNQTEEADSAIAFLKNAVPDLLQEELVLQELQEELQEVKIPLQLDEKTLGIVYMLGKQEFETGYQEYGRLLLECLLQVTGDAEVEALLKS